MIRADLALIGFGHVGRRFARLLARGAAQRASAANTTCDCRIVGIATARHGTIWHADGLDVEAAA